MNKFSTVLANSRYPPNPISQGWFQCLAIQLRILTIEVGARDSSAEDETIGQPAGSRGWTGEGRIRLLLPEARTLL